MLVTGHGAIVYMSVCVWVYVGPKLQPATGRDAPVNHCLRNNPSKRLSVAAAVAGVANPYSRTTRISNARLQSTILATVVAG